MRRLIAIAGVAALASAALAATVLAKKPEWSMVRLGNLILLADGNFQPERLPQRKRVPIEFSGQSRIEMLDKSQPPALQHAKLEFDRDAKLETTGLPRCNPAHLQNATPRQARKRCAGAIVAKGEITASVAVTGLGRTEIKSPLTLFNGPPKGGDPTVIGHAQATFPFPETYVITVPIERRRGTFGYRAAFDVPKIAGGLGALTSLDIDLGRRYTAGGKKRSYVLARCSDGLLQAQGYFDFGGNDVIYGSVFKSCYGG